MDPTATYISPCLHHTDKVLPDKICIQCTTNGFRDCVCTGIGSILS